MAQATNEERLDRVEAQLAIADLLHEYARLIRRDQPEEVSALFVPGATFEIRDGHPDSDEFTVRTMLESTEAIHAYMEQGKGKPHPVPIIRNIMVEVDGHNASVNALMEAQIYGTEHRISGEYRDTARRIDGRWLFASRCFTMYAGGSLG